MNRRQAIEALVALPALTRISSAEVTPTDVIVVEIPGQLSDEGCTRVKAILTEVWPDRKIVVCCNGMRLKLMPT